MLDTLWTIAKLETFAAWICKLYNVPNSEDGTWKRRDDKSRNVKILVRIGIVSHFQELDN